MFNLDNIANEHKDSITKWPYIPDNPFRILIIWCSASGNTNVLLNLIKEQDSDNPVDKIYLYAKDLNEPKYQFLIRRRENAGIKHLHDPKAFIEYSAYMDDINNTINDYNPKRNRKNLVVFNVFNDMIADIMTNKMS